MLTVVSVAYPLAPVGPDAAGGAEQVLGAIDAALHAAGHRSRVIACAGSLVRGELLPIPAAPDGCAIDGETRHRAIAAVRARLADAMPGADLVHLHGVDFADYLPPSGPPVLATLHLPPAWYDAAALRPPRPRFTLNCVSAAQDAACPRDTAPRAAPIPNGVALAALGRARHARRGFALTLGRICPEKGQHLAIEACRRAGRALAIAGPVFPYPAHARFFAERVAPALGRGCRWLGSVGFARKRRLLSAARCLLVPSLAPETSSLVAMEALGCGTPVVAFRTGALPEIVRHGVTGFLVDDVAAMAEAIERVDRLDPARCRADAARRFDLGAMTDRYLALHRRLAAA